MLLTAKLVDEVHYNERGNEVFLVKHLDKLKEQQARPRRAPPAEKRVLPFSGHRRLRKRSHRSRSHRKR